jgi:hypothetical protein
MDMKHVKIRIIYKALDNTRNTTFFNILLTVHVDNLCNENQLDALSILNLFDQTTSTCFGHVYCPSSGGIHCKCTAVGACSTYR